MSFYLSCWPITFDINSSCGSILIACREYINDVKAMERSQNMEQNPWIDEQSQPGILKALLIAEQTGLIRDYDSDIKMKVRDDAEKKYPSLKMIALLSNIDKLKGQITSLQLEIQCRLQDKETADITHTSILEKRIAVLRNLNEHLQQLVSDKETLVSKLQQPYVGEFIKIQANYKHFASELFPQVVEVLSELGLHLDNLDWAAQVNMCDGQLDSLLEDLASVLATLHKGFLSMTQLRDMFSSFHSKSSHCASVNQSLTL